MICDLARRHPRLEIELKTSDYEVDLVAERLDMAVRIRHMRDSVLKRGGQGPLPRRAAAINVAVAQGLGLGYSPFWQVRGLVDRGEVEIVLEAFEAPRVPVHAVWRPTRTPLANARLFADALAVRLRRETL